MKAALIPQFPVLLASIISTCSSVLHAETKVSQPAEKPNIVILLADDMGYADMSFLPQSPKDVNTPNIDRLAQTGTYYRHAYGTAAICSPARVGFITGRYQQRWGNYWYSQGGLPKEEPTIPKALKPLGYATFKIGKNHTNGGTGAHPLDHGFDDFLGFFHHTWDYIRLSEEDTTAYNARRKGSAATATIGALIRGRDTRVSYENRYTTDIFAEEAVKFIKRDHKSPFYLQLSFNAVHHPTYIGKPEYLEKFGAPQPKWDRDADSWEFPFWDPKKIGWQKWHQQWGHLKSVDPYGRKRYLACVHGLDLAVGRVLDALEEKGLRKNTLVVFISDNGGTINTYANNTPLAGYKYMNGEGGIRIPMILSMPGTLPEGSMSDDLASTLDIFPTIADLSGLKKSDLFDGESLIDGTPRSAELHWEKNGNDWAVRKGKWKLHRSSGWNHSTYTLDDKNMASPAKENVTYPKGLLLYNVVDDPGCTTNLADKHPEVVAMLLELHNKWRAQMAKPKRSGSLHIR
ncbi:arylsulfatase [Oceaniferula spumae]|uniref:Arylsulfatase n=1 Tax=Oceaniferula spumae TaxID=2979115 RepID=A0AAT9FS67_9BACT